MDSLAYPCPGTHSVTVAATRYARAKFGVPLRFVKWESVGNMAGINTNKNDAREASVADVKSYRNNHGTAARLPVGRAQAQGR